MLDWKQKKGEKKLYRLARQRDRAGKDVQDVRVLKDGNSNVKVSLEAVLKRWKEYFEKLMNKENDRELRTEEGEVVNEEINCINKEEVKKALRKMKKGGPDELPVKVWKCMGEMGIKFLIRQFNRLLGEQMPEEWRRSVLITIYKNKRYTQCCGNYRGIKMISHTMKVWERIIKARLKNRVEISEQQYEFMLGKGTTDAFKNVDRQVQGGPKRATCTLCIRGARKSLQQGSERRAVVLYEKISNGRKVCATCTGYASKTVVSVQ